MLWLWLWLAPIVGGSDDAGDLAVVNLTIAGGQCSGVVVAPRVVVTAAHCIAPGPTTAGDATVTQVWVDRYYDGSVDHDLAALRLDRDAGVTPLAIAAPQLGAVHLVGFGATAPNGPRGTRHAIDTQIIEVASRYARAGGAGMTTCTGDSGGAAIDPDGALVGVITAGDDACTAPSFLVRPDSEPQLAEVIAAWTTPPTDPCGFEGTCAADCPMVDLDCPLGGLAGATCTAASACESRLCIGDDRGQFCSAPCATDADCPAPLDACSGGTCTYAHGVPGIAGTRCHADADCRSGLCDVDAQICTVPCGASDACPSGLACEPVAEQRACTEPGGCAIASGGTWMIFVIAVLAYLMRNRQTRAACPCSTVSKFMRPRSMAMVAAPRARSRKARRCASATACSIAKTTTSTTPTR
ncbi:MAG TPA: trypsin-like serine protease [Kofleriaceae bacterium]|nr:trypsin-like serine protease [Kofleriaceae bacterium]